MTTNDLRREASLSSIQVPGRMNKAHRRSRSLAAVDWHHTLVMETTSGASNLPSLPSSPVPIDPDPGPHLLSPDMKAPHMVHVLPPPCESHPHLLSPENSMTLLDVPPPPPPPSDDVFHLLSPDNVMKVPGATTPTMFKQNSGGISSFEGSASDSTLPFPDLSSFVDSMPDIENHDARHELLGSPVRRRKRVQHPAGFATDCKPSRYNLLVLGGEDTMDGGPPRRIFVPNTSGRRRSHSETLRSRAPSWHRRDSYASLYDILDAGLLRDDIPSAML